jgi:hypothetical protein
MFRDIVRKVVKSVIATHRFSTAAGGPVLSAQQAKLLKEVQDYKSDSEAEHIDQVCPLRPLCPRNRVLTTPP